MKIEYDNVRDLLYLYFASPKTKAAQTITIVPGVNADFSKEGKLIGIEVIEAMKVMGRKIEFDLPKIVFSPKRKREYSPVAG